MQGRLFALRSLRRFARICVSIGIGVAIWWTVVAVFSPAPFILPGPYRVAVAASVNWWFLAWNALITMSEILIGLTVGVVLGVLTALVMSALPIARRFLLPAVVISQALPVFAIAPLLVTWFGYGLASKIIMATLIIYFPITSAFYDGLRRTDPGLLDLLRLFGGSTAQGYALVRIPAAMPSLVSGLRVAAAIAPIGAIVGEWVGSAAGLGFVMLQANARMQTDLMFAALVVLAMVALAVRFAVDRLTRPLIPWVPEDDGAPFLKPQHEGTPA